MSGIPRPGSSKALTAQAGGCPVPDTCKGSGRDKPRTLIATVPKKSGCTPRKPLKLTPLAPPSKLKAEIFDKAKTRGEVDKKSRVFAVGSKISKADEVPVVMTKCGPQKVIQQSTIQRIVQRTPKAEYVGKYIRSVDVDNAGQATQVEMTTQEIDPTYGTDEDGVNEAVGVTSVVSVTRQGKQVTRQVKKRTVKSAELSGRPNMNPLQVNRLVREEIEDVENTLKMAPPDIITGATPERFPLKKKWHMLRLNSESVAMLDHMVTYPTPTADEADTEASPEVMAAIAHALEKGAVPESAPAQVFNTLFPEIVSDKTNVSTVAPGPLEDVVVPVESPNCSIAEQSLNDEMEKVLTHLQTAPEIPPDDFAFLNQISPAKRAYKAKHDKVVMVGDELPPWVSQDIEFVSAIVGADPIFSSTPFDASILNTSKEMTDELSKGMDYFIEGDGSPYVTHIQLRGTHPPSWFPGYVSAFPHLPDLTKLNRCPAQVMHSAWRAVQPKIFPEDSVIIM